MERQSPNLQLKSEIGTVFFSSTTMCRYCRSSDASFISCSHPQVFSDGLLPQIVCDTCDHRDSLPGHSSDHRVLQDMSCSLKKLKIHFVITAFNRPQMLKRLLEQIFEQASDYEIHVDVFEDGGVDPRPELVGFSNLTLFRREANGGKSGFWHLIHLAFQRIEQVHADYYFFLQDDIEIPAGCLTRSIEQLKAISDATCDCLNLLFDESRGGKPSWTGFKPQLARFGDHLFCKTQWTDMLFLARRSFFEHLNFRILPVPPQRWRHDRFRSSGVGEQISLRLDAAGRSIYQVTETLVAHNDHPSAMHPELRRVQPLIARRKNLRIGGLATIPQRQHLLARNLPRILSQLDELHIYLNGFDRVPAFLSQPHITCYLASEHDGDLGDAGKFYAYGQSPGYYFSLDDDIQYPTDYVDQMTSRIDRYERRFCVGVHGIIIPGQVSSFYRQRRVFHGRRSLSCDRPVHLLGTGLMALHTSALTMTPADFLNPNMADIWIGILSQRQQTGMVAIKRSGDWIRFEPTSSSIYATYRNRDLRQTEVVNSIAPWILWAQNDFERQSCSLQDTEAGVTVK